MVGIITKVVGDALQLVQVRIISCRKLFKLVLHRSEEASDVFMRLQKHFDY